MSNSIDLAKIEAKRITGFDWLRVFAPALVTYQHACTIMKLDTWTKWHRLDIGQLGVCIFLGISAILAAQDHRPPREWLRRRLVRIMPAYWIVMLVSFCLTWLMGHKIFDGWQFISQMFGTGLFTHADNLVNSPTWFVSLLLALYFVTFFIRLANHPRWLAMVLLLSYLAYVVLYRKHYAFFDHINTYAICTLICMMIAPRKIPTAMLYTGLALSLLPLGEFYHLINCASVLVLIGSLWHLPQIGKRLAFLVDYSYEYYLVHGILLNLSIEYIHDAPLIAVVTGIVLSYVAAIGLSMLVQAIVNPSQPQPDKCPSNSPTQSA